MIYNKKISKDCKDFTPTFLQCKLLTTDTEKLCYVDARTGALYRNNIMILLIYLYGNKNRKLA